MNTERKKAAPETEAANALPARGQYKTLPLGAAVTLVSPDPDRSFLVISGRGIAQLPESTLVFVRSANPDLWIQASELSSIVNPEHAVTSLLLSAHGTRTVIDELKRELGISRDAYWKIFREKRMPPAKPAAGKQGKARRPRRREGDAGRNP